MMRFLRDNGLSVVTVGLFLVFLVGQSVSGWMTYNQEEQDHGKETVGYLGYLSTSHFMEATFENWESEFLQMGMLVLLTVKLRQKGSPESKKFEPEAVDREPGTADMSKAPWPVRYGGLAQAAYSHSLSAALLGLFAVSFLIHAWSGAKEFSEEQLEHGAQAVSMLGYLANSRFWFESFQNWQSEFLAVAALAMLAVVLREKGSHMSKPVDAPHDETGESDGPKPEELPEGHQPWPGAARAA